MKRQKKQLFHKQVAASSNKTKTAWRIIKGNLENSHYDYTIHRIKSENGFLEKPVETAEAFNEYSINTNTNVTIKYSDIVKASNFLNKYELHNRTHMETIPVTETEVINIIRALKPKGTAGYDGISNSI